MTYKGYEVTAEVRVYEPWIVDADGQPVERIDNSNSDLAVAGYAISDYAGALMEYMDGASIKEVKERIDSYYRPEEAKP